MISWRMNRFIVALLTLPQVDLLREGSARRHALAYYFQYCWRFRSLIRTVAWCNLPPNLLPGTACLLIFLLAAKKW